MCRVLEEPTLDLPDGLALHHQGELDGGHVRVVLDFVVLIQKKMGDMFAFNYFDIFVIHSYNNILVEQRFKESYNNH